MRVLIGFESSGVVRQAFRGRGHDAWSCDFQAADDGSPHHIRGDVWDHCGPEHGWQLGIFHPTCTYLTLAAAWAFKDGPYHQNLAPGTLVGAARRAARDEALEDVRRLMALPYPHAIENPRGFIGTMLRAPSQVIQPHEYGEDASKATCLWLNRLPLLRPTGHVAPRLVDGRPRWANQTDSGQNRLSPGADRWKLRSRTYPGIAEAFARQWGCDLAWTPPVLADWALAA